MSPISLRTDKLGPNRLHADYFLSLEQDLIRAGRYVDLSAENEATFSLEFARMLLAAGSEADTVARLLCQKIAPGKKAANIDQYRETILSVRGYFPELTVLLINKTLTSKPFESWDNGSKTNPAWWDAYNGVKHFRADRYTDASLRNAFDATAGLAGFLALLVGREAMEGVIEETRLFNIPHWAPIDQEK